MGVTQSYSSLFGTPGFLVSPSDLLMSSIFGLRSSYMLEYCWLFALLLRSARCFTGVEGKWTLLPPISPPSSLHSPAFYLSMFGNTFSNSRKHGFLLFPVYIFPQSISCNPVGWPISQLCFLPTTPHCLISGKCLWAPPSPLPQWQWTWAPGVLQYLGDTSLSLLNTLYSHGLGLPSVSSSPCLPGMKTLFLSLRHR